MEKLADKLEKQIYKKLRFPKNPNNSKFYLDLNHRILIFPKQKGEKSKKTIELIANIAESFFTKKGFRVYNKITDTLTEYKSLGMTIQKKEEIYCLVIGAKQSSNFYKVGVILPIFDNLN